MCKLRTLATMRRNRSRFNLRAIITCTQATCALFLLLSNVIGNRMFGIVDKEEMGIPVMYANLPHLCL